MQKKFNYIFYIVSLIGLVMCCKQPNKKVKSEVVVDSEKVESKEIEVVKPKPWDSLTHNNAIDFLIAYEKLHKENKVIIKTRLGNMTVQLYEDTPLHRASFLFLTNTGYYSTTCFHRVVPGFIVQGGNSEGTNTMEIKNKYENYTIPPEFRSNRKHKFGALAASREWENNISKKSNPFEFYFIQAKNGAHHIDGEHTIFGEVIDGFEVLDKIAKVKTGRDEWPLENVYMEIEVVE